MTTPREIQGKTEAMREWLVETRRDFHMHPELGFEEQRTAQRVTEALRSFGLEVREGVGKTGVIGLLRAEVPGRTLGLRADMDALPIQEENDVPYRSMVPGKMHACGHDAHTTMLLGAARLLAENRHWLRGRRGAVKFVFQPGEEGFAGAKAMIEDGALSDPPIDLFLAAHVYPLLPVGTIAVTPGPALAASDRFRVTIVGKGGHAAHPQKTRDPVLAAAQTIVALQSLVSRNTAPLDAAVLSVTKIEGGTAFNVIPNEVALGGSVRTLRQEVQQQMIEGIERVVKGVTQALGMSYRYEYSEGYPILVNDEAAVAFVRQVAGKVVGEAAVQQIEPSMGAEDFAFFLQQVPGVMYRVCTGNPAKGITEMVHSSRFDIDEDALPIGVRVFAQAALDFLE